eukprot:CAMPEP_0174230330 /NCGR_PEP_ID=MMETSP0417-20130205/1097_1 /TAXON_ID=242541 /ORGANISM="Mayorella sp, Strain BSH-02190019" /LENGTH=546 /DNA_ID=CAMNT_0015307987 /DNA_START=83 /DNA_END=1720 /DNA_ORIENTATION=+
MAQSFVANFTVPGTGTRVVDTQERKMTEQPGAGARRYRAGQVPHFAVDSAAGAESSSALAAVVSSASSAASTVVEDRRLRRVQNRGKVDRKEALQRRRRRILQAEVVSKANSDSDSGSGSDGPEASEQDHSDSQSNEADAAERARRRRALLLQQQQSGEAGTSAQDLNEVSRLPRDKQQDEEHDDEGAENELELARLLGAAEQSTTENSEFGSRSPPARRKQRPQPSVARRASDATAEVLVTGGDGPGAQRAAGDVSESDASSSSEWETDSEYSSGSESDSEEEGGASTALRIRPTFVPKSKRLTKAAQEREERQAEEAKKRQEERLERRRNESKQKVGEVVAAVAAETVSRTSCRVEETELDPVGDEQEMQEYELWKQRELDRLRRERVKRLESEAEERERERRAALTDEQIRLEDQDSKRFTKEKSKMKFMQKYYHRGAFFQDTDDEVLKRDVTAATGEDLLNRAALPTVMQVKRFGIAGRSKYTHLVDQDTLGNQRDQRSLWGWEEKDEFARKLQRRMGGTGRLDERVSKRQRSSSSSSSSSD